MNTKIYFIYYGCRWSDIVTWKKGIKRSCGHDWLQVVEYITFYKQPLVTRQFSEPKSCQPPKCVCHLTIRSFYASICPHWMVVQLIIRHYQELSEYKAHVSYLLTNDTYPTVEKMN